MKGLSASIPMGEVGKDRTIVLMERYLYDMCERYKPLEKIYFVRIAYVAGNDHVWILELREGLPSLPPEKTEREGKK